MFGIWDLCIICFIIGIVMACVAIVKDIRERKKREFQEPLPKLAEVSFSTIEIPISAIENENMYAQDSDTPDDLSDVTKISIMDELKHEICLERPSIEDNSTEYREIIFANTSHVIGSASSISASLAQETYNMAKLAEIAPNGLFTTKVHPEDLSRFSKDGSFSTIIHSHGPNGIKTHQGFIPVEGFPAINPVSVISNIFRVGAAFTGQYYLYVINDKLTSIKGEIDNILSMLIEDDRAAIQYAQKRLFQISGHKHFVDDDIGDIRRIEYEVGKIYEKYKNLYFKSRAELLQFQPVIFRAGQRLKDYTKKVNEFYRTILICIEAHQVRLIAKLVEISVYLNRNLNYIEFEDLFRDANDIYNDVFDRAFIDNPDATFTWVIRQGKHCLEKMPATSSKKNNMLEPIKMDIKSFSEDVGTMIKNRKYSKKILDGLTAPQRILILPGKEEQKSRYFIEF